MKKLHYFILILCVIHLSCNPTEPEPTPPQLPDKSIMLINFPTNAPSQVNDVVEELTTDIIYCFQMFDSAKGENPIGKHPNWTWRTHYETTHENFEVTIIAKVVSENSISWEIILDGTHFGTSYDNFLFLEGTTQPDGKSGSLDVYSFYDNEILIELGWTKNKQGVLSLSDDNPSPSYLKRFDLIGHPDGSGSLTVTKKDIKIFEASWDATGAGSWVTYDATTGQQTDSGSWSA
ncbi:MAG: hypothetical protein ACE5HI_11195 [bacterium]